MWLDSWSWDPAHFGFLEIHVIDTGFFTFSAICCVMSYDPAVKTRSFQASGWTRCLSDLDFFVVILLVVVRYVCLEASLRESSVGYVHWNRLVVQASWGIGQVVLGGGRCLSLLILVSLVEEMWSWLLGFERVLERSSRWVVVSRAYPFDELLHFGCLYGSVFNVVVGSREGRLHHIFKY